MKNILENKKAILPRNLIVIVVLIGMIIVASSYWINAWEDKYHPIEAPNLSSSYNAITEVKTSTDVMEKKLQPEEKDAIIQIGWLDFIVTGGYQVLISVLSVPVIIVGFVFDLTAEFGIPTIYRDGVIVLITVGAVFGIVGALFRRKT